MNKLQIEWNVEILIMIARWSSSIVSSRAPTRLTGHLFILRMAMVRSSSLQQPCRSNSSNWLIIEIGLFQLCLVACALQQKSKMEYWQQSYIKCKYVYALRSSDRTRRPAINNPTQHNKQKINVSKANQPHNINYLNDSVRSIANGKMLFLRNIFLYIICANALLDVKVWIYANAYAMCVLSSRCV